jgi:hypothetical protein
LLLTTCGACVGEDEGPVVGEGEGVGVGLGEGVGEVVGVGVTVGVAVGVLTRLAVNVPGPFIVAIMEASFSLLMFTVSLDHERNVYPELGVTVIDNGPAFSQTLVPEGLVVPAPEGLTANDTKY